MTRLLLAEQVAGAPNVEIVTRQGEAGAERVERLHDFQSFFRGFRRSEEHTSELQSLMRISYAVFCLKEKKIYLASDRTTPHTTTKINNLNAHEYSTYYVIAE